jgi:3-oxoacyl-[acyl-carrier-protein] synthase III
MTIARAKIVGVGAYAPKRVVTNDDLAQSLHTSDDWIARRTGIRQRHVADAEESTSDLAAHAARHALARAGVGPEEVDLIVVGTTTGDMLLPSTASFVQRKLGACRAAALDVAAACAGSVYGLSVGAQYIATRKHRTVLVIGAEVYSRIVDWTDRTTAILFGDAAGAVVLRPSPDASGIVDADLHADGRYTEILCAPGGGARHPASHESIERRLHYVRMTSGSEVFKLAVRMLSDSAQAILRANGLGPADVTLFIPHQANRRIIEAAAERLGVPMDRVFVNADRYGNTASASVFVALEEAWSTGRIHPGDLLLLAAFGAGFTWGAALVRW